MVSGIGVASVLGLLILCEYPTVLLGARSFVARDYLLFGLPLANFAKVCIWQGIFPHWNPLNDCGIPFFAQWNTMLLYPASAIYYLLPLPWGLNVFLLCHQGLAGLGMWLLLRDRNLGGPAAGLGAFSYAFNGLASSFLSWPNIIAGYALLPWIVFYVTRALRSPGASCTLAILLSASQLFCGAPEVTAFTWLIVLVFALYERPLSGGPAPFPKLVLIIALALGMAAVQLLPFMRFAELSDRSGDFRGDPSPVPILGFLNLIFPSFHMVAAPSGVLFQPGQRWINSYSLPALTGFFGFVWLFGRKSRITKALMVFGGASMLMSFGDRCFLFPFLRLFLPFLGKLNFLAKFTIPMIFAAAFVAAHGFQKFDRVIVRRPALARGLLGLPAALYLGLLGAATALAYLKPIAPGEWPRLVTESAARLVLLWVLVAALFQFGFALTKQNIPLGVILIAAGVFADFKFIMPEQNPSVPTAEFNLRAAPKWPLHESDRAMLTETAAGKFLHASDPDYVSWMSKARLGEFCNCNLLDGAAKVGGFFSLYPNSYVKLMGIVNSIAPAKCPGLLDLFGVSRITEADDLTQWVSRPVRLALVSGGQAPAFQADFAAMSQMSRAEFDPLQVVFLNPADGQSIPSDKSDIRVLETKVYPNRVEFRASVKHPGLILLRNTYYPAWRATVDGEPAMVDRANVTFQALSVQKSGDVNVVVEFIDDWFKWGAAVSLVSLILLIVTRQFLRNLRIREEAAPVGQ